MDDSEQELKECPFCNEIDFDLIGLKDHLLNDRCDVFNEIISPAEEKTKSIYKQGFKYLDDAIGD